MVEPQASPMAESTSFAPAGFGGIERRAALVGRAGELRELDAALRAVHEQGEARTITLVGAAGIGKTRLVRDFLSRQRASDRGLPRVFRGSARADGGAYDVFARVLRARFGIIEGMDREAAKAQIRTRVASVFEDRKVEDVCYFLGQLLDLEFMGSPLIEAVRLDARQMASLRTAVLRRFFEADSRNVGRTTRDTDPDLAAGTRGPDEKQGPYVLVFDDLQHAHDDSLDLLGHLVDTLDAPILVVCLARPDMLARREDWPKHGAARHRIVEVGPLGETDASRMMEELLAPCGGAEGLDELVESACTLAGGNPALLERTVHILSLIHI